MLPDYQAALESAAIFDLTDHAKIELTGRDAREFLHNLCSQDVKSLPVGEMREAFLTTNKARMLGHLWVWHRKQDVLFLDGAKCVREKVLEHFNKYHISEQVEIRDRTSDYEMLRVVGPKVFALSDRIALPHHRRHRILGIDAIDVFIADEDGDAEVMHERIAQIGAVSGGSETYNLLRVEAGLPEYGIDIDEDRLAMEVNRTSQAISYSKGCYLGQETIVMARDRGQVNRLLMGIRIASGEPLVRGTRLFRGNEDVGQVTTSVFSPRLNQVIALAYLRRGSWDAGTEMVVEPTTDGRTAIACTLPFCNAVA